jgi:DNA-binding response OmpR family regulator
MTRILIAEDEPRIASFVAKGLKANGFSTSVATDGDEALERAISGEFDLLILDLGLPGRDGFAVLKDIRAVDPAVPVIILTARDGLKDTLAGLEGGADDYITKPFRFEELLARIGARLRGDRGGDETELRAGDLVLDLRARRVKLGDRAIELTAREFALAETFFRHAGKVLSREQLLGHAWGYQVDPRSNVVDVYVGYLRKKLGDESIVTVRGMGYRLRDPEEPLPPSPGRVLVVEDNPRLAKLVARALSGHDRRVVVAGDGDVAVFLGTTERYDAILLDIGLPGTTSGLDVLRAIKGTDPDVPVVVITGQDAPGLRQECLMAGASSFLTKPVSMEELRALLASNRRPPASEHR